MLMLDLLVCSCSTAVAAVSERKSISLYKISVYNAISCFIVCPYDADDFYNSGIITIVLRDVLNEVGGHIRPSWKIHGPPLSIANSL